HRVLDYHRALRGSSSRSGELGVQLAFSLVGTAWTAQSTQLGGPLTMPDRNSRVMGRIRIGSALAALLLSVAACQLMTPPPGFVSLDDFRGDYDFRAVSPDGLVVSAQELDHEPKGDLAFWTRA